MFYQWLLLWKHIQFESLINCPVPVDGIAHLPPVIILQAECANGPPGAGHIGAIQHRLDFTRGHRAIPTTKMTEFSENVLDESTY